MDPRIPLCIALLAAGSALAAESKSTSSGTTHTFSATVSPGSVHEECVKLAKGESRKYEWSANAALDFNIHYHEGKEVFYPVKKDSAMKDKGTFRAKIAQDYCWMWTAKTPAKVEGRLEK
jgi:hypothetical protein